MACKTKILSVEGNIGTGKSTVIQELQKNLSNRKDIVFLPEPVDVWNTIKDDTGTTILEHYYKDQDTYAFPFQMMAYISRLSLLRAALRENPAYIITERSLMTDRMVFASMLRDDGKISTIGYSIYLKWFDEFHRDLPPIEYVYMRCDPVVSHERVIARARPGETIPIEYLKKCHDYHENWLTTSPDCKLCLDATLDMANNMQEYTLSLVNSIAELCKSPEKALYKLMFDGASRGNPGPAATGYVIYDADNNIIHTGGAYLGETLYTNNEAEYYALIDGLEYIYLHHASHCNTLVIQGDSKLVINQVCDTYKVHAANLVKLHKKVKQQLHDKLNKIPDITFTHVKREHNKAADAAANKALDNALS